jgi:hypothetical protein
VTARPYPLEFRPAALRQLRKLPKDALCRVRAATEALRDNPSRPPSQPRREPPYDALDGELAARGDRRQVPTLVLTARAALQLYGRLGFQPSHHDHYRVATPRWGVRTP